jgi:uncharacterized membrane protein HdeD (DUF308 family)
VFIYNFKDFTMEAKHVLPFFIPIIAIIMGIGLAMLALWLDHEKKTRMFELHHQERLAALERGIELPPLPAEFFQGRSTPSQGHGVLLWGLILVFVGLAFAIAQTLNGDTESAAWALVPIAGGAAQLIYYLVVHRRKQPALPATP